MFNINRIHIRTDQLIPKENKCKAFTLFEKLNLILSGQEMSLRKHIFIVETMMPSICSQYKLLDLVLHTLRYFLLFCIVNLLESKSYETIQVENEFKCYSHRGLAWAQSSVVVTPANCEKINVDLR